MSKSTKSVSAFTIKKATFDLNEYNKSYSNQPLYNIIGDMVKERIKETEMSGVPLQVFEYFYDRSDFRSVGEVETYYIVGFKDEYNMCEYKKPFVSKFIYGRLISFFNQYLSTTLYDMGNEDNQKLVDALNIVYKDNSSDINKSVKLVDTLWNVYCDDDTLESNFDIRDKITSGFMESGYYKEFVSHMERIITDKFNTDKVVATQTLLEMMLRDKVNEVDEKYGVEFQSQLKWFRQLQSEILDLNNTINDL
jgi:hypothetical protein